MRRRAANIPIRKGMESKNLLINADRKCIVFDLDETLIHCNDSLTPPHDVKLPIKFPTG
jgi:CTD small phosphatase-like protein 2